MPSIIEGDASVDSRGSVSFINDFDLAPIRRTYFITNDKSAPLRAWQAHKLERKWFMCLVGSFKILLVKIDDWQSPSKNLTVQSYLLEAEKPAVLYVPKNYANAICSVKGDSILQVYSDTLLNEAKNDQFKFPEDQWSIYNAKANEE
jgi:dTDP-4-dehydrorhamnose 3,5-epimerase-like enzyme